MPFIAYFSENGSPKTGLSPTIIARKDSDGTVVVNGLGMTETGNGFYRYTYAAQDFSEGYHYIADSVTLTGSERYAVGHEPAWSKVVEGALTEHDILRGLLAVFMAKRTGMGTGITNFRDQANTKNRIAATLDGDGNVTAITLDLT